VFLADTKAAANLSDQGPQPQILWDTPNLRVIVGGLKAGQQIPSHPEAQALYYFLEGNGVMIVDAEQIVVEPGVTVIVPDGATRGMTAQTTLVFLGARVS
jgi:quercetin dioxygenase-like cupin family protein